MFKDFQVFRTNCKKFWQQFFRLHFSDFWLNERQPACCWLSSSFVITKSLFNTSVCVFRRCFWNCFHFISLIFFNLDISVSLLICLLVMLCLRCIASDAKLCFSCVIKSCLRVTVYTLIPTRHLFLQISIIDEIHQIMHLLFQSFFRNTSKHYIIYFRSSFRICNFFICLIFCHLLSLRRNLS